ncbi:phage tail tape measure protein [Chitinimonas lacunae]|uniref:Phage tail tape measure protein n=1 Tax=Chitinimonas lacunae TaxID=1963018 RepID=A0ABV8MMP7_9NEIS
MSRNTAIEMLIRARTEGRADLNALAGEMEKLGAKARATGDQQAHMYDRIAVGLRDAAARTGKLGEMGRQLQTLGETGAVVADEIDALVDEMNKLARADEGIAKFRALDAQAKAAANSFDKLQLELQATQTRVATTAQSVAGLSASVNTQATVTTAAKDKLATLRVETAAAAEAAKAAGVSTKQLTQNQGQLDASMAPLVQRYRDLVAQERAASAEHAAEKAKLEQLQGQLVSVTREEEKLQRSLKAQAEASRSAQGAMETMRSNAAALAAQLKTAGVDVNNLQRANQGLRESYAQLVQSAAQLKVLGDARQTLGLKAHQEVEAEVRKLTQAYETLKNSGKLTAKELTQAYVALKQQTDALRQSAQAAAQSSGELQTVLAATAASAAGLAFAGKEAISFESAMAEVAKVANGTDAELATLANRLKQMASEDLPYAATELAQIAAAGAKMFPTAELEKYVRIVGEIGIAFGMSAEQAGTALSNLQTNLGLNLDECLKLADTINALNGKLGVAEASITEVLVRTGSLAKQFGLTADEAAGLSASMLKLGKTPEVAATALSALLNKLANASSQGEDFQQALVAIGTSSEQFAAAVRRNPQQALSELLGTLERLDNATQGQIISRLFGPEYVASITSLVSAVGTYNKAMVIASDTAKNAGAVHREFSNRIKTAEVQLQFMSNSLRYAAIELGTTFLPLIKKVANGVGEAGQAVAQFIQEFPRLSLAAAAIAAVTSALAALGLAFVGLAGIAGPTIATVSLAIGKLAPVMGTALTAARGLAGGLAAIGASAAGVLAAGAAGYGLGKVLSDNSVWARQLGVAMVAMVESTKLAFRGMAETVRAAFSSTDTVAAAVARNRQQFDDLKKTLKELWDEAEKGPPKAAEAAQQVATELEKHRANVKATEEAYKGLSEGAKTALIQLAEAAKDGSVGAQQLSDAIDKAIQAADSPEAFKKIQEQLKGLLDSGKLTQTTFDELSKSITITANAQAEALRQQQEEARASEEALAGVSGKAKEALAALIKLREDGKASADELKTAVVAAIDAADSPAAFDGIRKQLSALMVDGKLTQATFDELTKSIEEAGNQLGKPLDQAADLVRALKGVGDVAKQSSEEAGRQIEANIGGRLSKLRDEDLPAVARAVEKEFGKMSAAAKVVAGEALKRLGIDADLALEGISSEAKKAAASLEALGATGAATARGLKLALDEALTKADTPAAVDKIRVVVKSLGEAGRLSGDQLVRALDAVNQRAKEVSLSVSELEEDFQRLGITSAAAMQAQAEAAQTSLRRVEEAYRSGKATALDYAGAAQAALAAVEKVGTDTEVAMARAKDEMAEAAVTASEFRGAAERAGLIAKKAGEDAATAANKAKTAVQEQGAAAEQGAEKQAKAVEKVVIAYEKLGLSLKASKRLAQEIDLANQQAGASSETAIAAMERAQQSVKSQLAAAAALTQQYEQMQVAIGDQIPTLDRLRNQFDALDDAQLEGLQSALDGARQRVIDLRNEVRDAAAALDEMADGLRDEIDQEDGNDQAVLARKYAKEKARLDEQRAKGGGDADVERSYREALTLLQEKQRREETEAKAKAAERAKSDIDKPKTARPEATPSTTKTERIEIVVGGRERSIDVAEGQGATVRDILDEIARAKQVSL